MKNSEYMASIIPRFAFEVRTNGPIDLKNQPDWYHPLYIYDGKIVDIDVLGNILFGWLGAYLQIDPTLSLMGASVIQTLDNWDWNNPTLKLDDPRDVMWWKYGYNLYFDKWSDENN